MTEHPLNPVLHDGMGLHDLLCPDCHKPFNLNKDRIGQPALIQSGVLYGWMQTLFRCPHCGGMLTHQFKPRQADKEHNRHE